MNKTGNDYRFLCYATGYTGDDIFVVDIHKDSKGKCRMKSCRPLDLENYVH